jgi:hypothetical protein
MDGSFKESISSKKQQPLWLKPWGRAEYKKTKTNTFDSVQQTHIFVVGAREMNIPTFFVTVVTFAANILAFFDQSWNDKQTYKNIVQKKNS